MSGWNVLLLFCLEKKSENEEILFEDVIISFMTLGRVDKSDSYVANHQGLTERCFLKTSVVVSKTTMVPTVSLSHQLMLCTILFYLYARSQCLFQMHLSVGQKYQGQVGIVDYLFFMIM